MKRLAGWAPQVQNNAVCLSRVCARQRASERASVCVCVCVCVTSETPRLLKRPVDQLTRAIRVRKQIKCHKWLKLAALRCVVSVASVAPAA